MPVADSATVVRGDSGNAQNATVKAFLMPRSRWLAVTLTAAFAPSKSSAAPPARPSVQVGPASVAAAPPVVASAVVVPVPSSKR